MSKHLATIKGNVMRRVYYYGQRYWTGFYEIYKDNDFVEHYDLWTGEIESPPIKVGEKVFIAELNKTIEITDRVRKLEGGYVYYTNDLCTVIEDEISKESLERAKAREKENIKASKESKPKKKWYQFWK